MQATVSTAEKQERQPPAQRHARRGLSQPNRSIEVAAAFKRGAALAEGMNLAKDLGNLPTNICTPSYLAKQAQELAKHYKLKCEVLERATWRSSAWARCWRSRKARASRPS